MYASRCFEFAVVYLSVRGRTPERFAPLWDALLAGYASVRALPLCTQPLEGDLFRKAMDDIREIAGAGES